MTRRITVITGHYGSGKSEISVNLALLEAERCKQVALVDLDVVNPYFRSREKRQLLEEAGVRVIANSFGQDQGVDIPAVSPEVYSPLQNQGTRAILDTGGDPVGARLLGTYRHYLQTEDAEILCVCNVARPETQTAEAIVEQIRGIEAASRLRVTGLINNTHMLEHTTEAYVERGNDVCRRVSELIDIPIRYVAVLAAVAPDIPGSIAGELIPIAMHLREAWMYA